MNQFKSLAIIFIIGLATEVQLHATRPATLEEQRQFEAALAASREQQQLEEALAASLRNVSVQESNEAALQRAIAESKKEAEQKGQAASASPKKSPKFEALKKKVVQLKASIQDAADCGYGAAKNAVLTMQWLQGSLGKISQAEFEKSYLQNEKRVPLAPLYKAVEKERGELRHDYLFDTEIESVILPQMVPNKSQGQIAAQFTVIGNIGDVANNLKTYGEIYPNLKGTVKNIREHEHVVHAFIINDASQANLAAAGHWITVIIDRTKDGITYYLIDSMAGYAEKFRDIPASELKELKDQTDKRLGALQKIIEKSPL